MTARNGMDADSVLEVLDALEAASVPVVVDGGWGVDALLQEQTRPHADLDLIASAADGDGLSTALGALGLRRRPGGSDRNFVLADERGREVDVHLVDLDERGQGSFRLPDGRTWAFPPQAFAGRGRIAEREVRCLSVDAQVQCHGQGYEPTEDDLRDMERLQDRFGVVLPLALVRRGTPAGLPVPAKAYLTRESVSAADDLEAPHVRRFDLPDDWSFEALVHHVLRESRLPGVQGGRATWALSSNLPLAVVAQEWDAPAVLSRLDSDRARLDAAGDELRLHWSYFAQRDPFEVLEVLRRLRLRAVVV